MAISLSISPHGRLLLEQASDDSAPAMPEAVERRIRGAFETGTAQGLLHLATAELHSTLPPPFAFARELAQHYLTRLCQTPGLDAARELPAVLPAPDEMIRLTDQAPPMRGLEYLSGDALANWWTELDEVVREQIRQSEGGAGAYLREKNPLWRLVGRVTFHLAENKRDELFPFAFLATYAHRLSQRGQVQHLPLSRALQEYADVKDRQTLLALLTPIESAAEKLPWVRELVDSGVVYQARAWTAKEAHHFLQDIPSLEASGLIVRVPDWWHATRPPRAQVSVRIGDAARTKLGADAMLDFSVGVTLEGEPISDEELDQLLNSPGGLVRLRGQWVEIDRERLSEALAHWKTIERDARGGGISFFEGMRLLAGASPQAGETEQIAEQVRSWTGIAPGEWLSQTLDELRDPVRLGQGAAPHNLRAELRPYQQTGVGWLRFMTRLGLGACLADDMGLGKTIQVLSLLLHLRNDAASNEQIPPSLLVVPASLIANWKSEISRFAPSLRIAVAHPSETDRPLTDRAAIDETIRDRDLVITTYGMLARIEPLRQRKWNLAILDEAQAVKNSGTRQAKAVKQLEASGRVAMTGTPIENRLSDLWSLFDFLNPGLLGSAKAFASYAKKIARQDEPSYAPLRALIKPYILRRLKTDKRIISDLPDKTEVKAFCGLSKRQAMIYAESVGELAEQLGQAEGIKRRGIVLAYLMRFKQICNHPSQWLGDNAYDPADSGKFRRLAEICEELAERQEKALIFTQFREIAAPLTDFLQPIFGRPGLLLHGGTAVGKRRELVADFQREDGPPFFVLSLKAGGTGLNLTEASHVIHFDRWWNPAVENQATDRAFRIGQKRNVMVHKFVCRGTVEEKIDELIGDKIGLSNELLEGGAERMLTEMNDRELLRFVSLDLSKAADE